MFIDREDAGRQLAQKLGHLGHDVVVLGLPRGGVPVAFEVAQALRAPLDVIVVRKLGIPHQPELAMGAVGEHAVKVLNVDILRAAVVSKQELAAAERRERAEVVARVRRFRGPRPSVPLQGKTVVLVDDGIATGSTMLVACQVARAHGARRVVVAVPVAARQPLTRLGNGVADEVLCLHTPSPFISVGQSYRDFTQVRDEEVIRLLERAGGTAGSALAAPSDPLVPLRDQEVSVRVDSVLLTGHLYVPAAAGAVVLFAHGSGSSRYSARNRYVAQFLNQAGLATLLFDLLTGEEQLDRSNVFDIDLLGERLTAVTRWLARQPGTEDLPCEYFGASTGAAAALVAAGVPGCPVAAVVSRGGRPDLAGDSLSSVRAPTLLIVGGRDRAVLELNRAAQRHLRCENTLAVVPGATHLFEEPGTLQAAAELARDWFLQHVVPA